MSLREAGFGEVELFLNSKVVAPLRGTLLVVGLLGLLSGLPAAAQTTVPPVAVFPLQDLSRGASDVNLPLTRYLSQRLAESGNELTSPETVIAFLAHNRIRSLGQLETFHVSRVRDELGAAFVLLGTVTQAKEAPNPSLGVTLSLVRTTDSRTVWSYVGAFSAADSRRLLGIGEPGSVADLQPLLGDEVVSRWPWDLLSQLQQLGSLSIQSTGLQPARVRPGAEVTATVRLRNQWPVDRAPRAFFQADDQLHAATVSPEGNVYEATWVAGEKDGRFPVSLVLEWPLYGRTETALLGSYLVDGTPPLLSLELRGSGEQDGIPVFRDGLYILPRMLIRKPLARWRLSFVDEAGTVVGADEDTGNLPETFFWQGYGTVTGTRSIQPEGLYEVVLEIWDQAGNAARASAKAEMSRSAPQVALVPGRAEDERVVDLAHEGKVPLAFWRLEMWSEEGKLLQEAEGTELPAQIGLGREAAEGDEKVRAVLTVRDVLGTSVRQDVLDVFGAARAPEADAKPKEDPKATQKWVDEF